MLSTTISSTWRRRIVSSVSILLLLSLFSACKDNQDVIADTVDGFFQSITSDDVESLSDYFPAFTRLEPPERDAYRTIFSRFKSWKIENMQIDGDNAVAKVVAVSDTGELSLHLPLRYIEKRWIIVEKTSMRLDLGTVPAK